MSQAEFRAESPYANFGMTAANAPADARNAFIRRTYAHLAAAIYAFVLLEWLLFAVGFPAWIMPKLAVTPYAWLIVLGAFMAVGWIANSWALSATSVGKQYAGLFLYVVVEAVIFVPLLVFAKNATVTFAGIDQSIPIIPAAAATTLLIFGGLTAITFVTKKDFTFLGGILGLAMIGAIGLIVVSVVFGFNIGIWFSWLMVILAAGYILYYTSAVMHRYRTDQHVAAALALFAALALLFWYVIQIFLASRD